MDRRESLHGNLDACIKSALPLPLIKECQYLGLTPICHYIAAYLGSFDPSNICTNWIGDSGSSPDPDQAFSFNVDNGQTFVVVVSELTPDAGCPAYTITVSPQAICGGATPTASPSATATVSATPTATATISATPTATATISATP